MNEPQSADNAARPVDAELPALARPDGHLVALAARRQARLQSATMWELGCEMLARINEGDGFQPNDRMGWLGSKLLQALHQNLDYHHNRFSRKRMADMYGLFHRWVQPRTPIEGACWVELGCGGVNPLGFLMAMLGLGARRGVGIDLDQVHDISAATRALADVAGAMILDPTSIIEDARIDGQQVLRNFAGFDFSKIRRGDAGGIDRERLTFLQESVYEMSLPDEEADVVFSNAFLEHVPDVARALKEIARITKPGGYSVHNIDMTDHRRYGDDIGPLDFLRVQSDAPIVCMSNRVRLSQFVEHMEAVGLHVVHTRKYGQLEVSDALRASFVEPYRSMSQDDLECTMVVILAQRQ